MGGPILRLSDGDQERTAAFPPGRATSLPFTRTGPGVVPDDRVPRDHGGDTLARPCNTRMVSVAGRDFAIAACRQEERYPQVQTCADFLLRPTFRLPTVPVGSFYVGDDAHASESP